MCNDFRKDSAIIPKLVLGRVFIVLRCVVIKLLYAGSIQHLLG